jgi:hypothetical protein
VKSFELCRPLITMSRICAAVSPPEKRSTNTRRTVSNCRSVSGSIVEDVAEGAAVGRTDAAVAGTGSDGANSSAPSTHVTAVIA